MTTEISSLMMPNGPDLAKSAGQPVKLEFVDNSSNGGKQVPVEGKYQPQEKSVNTTELREAVDQINSFVQTVQRDLTFSFDEGSGQTVIKVIDSKSGGLVRQIPSEEVLSMATHLRDVESMMGSQQSEMTEGMLFSDKT